MRVYPVSYIRKPVLREEEQDESEPKPLILHSQAYIAGNTPRSMRAVSNFNELCRKYLNDGDTAEVIDIIKNPGQARTAQVIATPTLVKEPLPR